MSAASGKVRWGVLGVAKIATHKVVPAMQRSAITAVTAIGSRDLARAQRAAESLGIKTAYGSYDALLNDPDIDAVYIPLPNHLHVPWSIRAAEAGKHVLCEKPIGLSAAEALRLLDVRDRTGVKMQEAFMVRTHPQWMAAMDLVRQQRIGPIRSVMGYFSYYNDNPANIRNVVDWGGGALMDVGCYLIHGSRWAFGREPARVMGLLDRDPRMKIDRVSSLMLDFDGGHAIGTCSMQVVAYQRIHFIGTTGRIEIEIPFNAPPDRSCRVFLDDGSTLDGRGAQVTDFPVCDQYTIQGDLFSRAIRGEIAQPLPLEDSVSNMRVIDAVMRSGGSARWEIPN